MGVFQTKLVGELCLQCGKITEGFPADSLEDLVKKYRTDKTFKLLFETCRRVLVGEQLQDWRRSTVCTRIITAMLSKVVMYFVTEINLLKWFKTSCQIDLRNHLTVKWAMVVDPEGVKTNGVLFKIADIPDGLPYYTVEISAREETVIQENFMDPGEDLHEGQGQAAHAWLKDEELGRRAIRLHGLPTTSTFGDFGDKVRAAQAALEAKETERLRTLELADIGRAPETALTIVQSGSRLRRPSVPAVPDFAAGTAMSPGPKRGSRQGRGAGRGMGLARQGAFLPLPAVPVSSRASSRSAFGSEGGSAASAVLAVAEPNKQDSASTCQSPAKNQSGDLSALAAASGVTNPILAKLLISSHGKPFPSIPEVIQGLQIKRELGGVVFLALSRLLLFWGL